MNLVYIVKEYWPRLAWVAHCSHASGTVEVYHGAGVEIRDGWFCEAVWDGAFDDGAFDETDVIAGSGARQRGDRLVFVSSGSTVDRLVSFARKREAWVSNTLVGLLRFLDADIDVTYPRYYQDFYSVVKGLDGYHRELATSVGAVELTYFNNIEWIDGTLRTAAKPDRSPEFSSFEIYREFLRGCMKRLAANVSDVNRSQPYRLLSTLSSGYDSTTVTTLAHEVGCREALTFDKDFLGAADSGQEVAQILDIATIRVGDADWRRSDKPEIPFLGANAMGEEVRFKGAERALSARVLLTGYHGDKVWSMDTKSLGPDIVRGDPSGSGLTEYRLWVGFIHCPVPFWGVRRIRELHAISNAAYMRPWDVTGDYSRPICRRLCEEAGLPRGSFGNEKRNASVILHNYDELLTPCSREDYFDWIRNKRSAWRAKGLVPPSTSAWWDRVAFMSSRVLAACLKRLPIAWRWAWRFEYGPVSVRRFLFPWALERAKSRYP